MQKSLYQTVDVGNTLSDSLCRNLSIRQRMQETLLSHSGCRRHSIGQRMQKSLYTQQMQESLNQKTDAGDTLSDAAAV